MSFTSLEKDKDFPLLWYIEKKSTGGKMALEIQDEMILKGVSKRVLFDPVDSLWTMLIEFNDNRQGTRIHAASMFRDTAIAKIIKITRTKEKRNIEGYKCNKIILESNRYISELWVTEQIRFNLGYIYKLLSHCGMMSDMVRKGDWFTEKKIME